MKRAFDLRPMLLMAMVILAATVSLRSFRRGPRYGYRRDGWGSAFSLTECHAGRRCRFGVGCDGSVDADQSRFIVSLTVLLHQEDG
jgi:hypothetical protein